MIYAIHGRLIGSQGILYHLGYVEAETREKAELKAYKVADHLHIRPIPNYEEIGLKESPLFTTESE